MLRVTRDQRLTTAITGSYPRPLWYDVNLRGQSFKAALGGPMARIPLVTSRDQIAEKEQPAYDAFMQSRAGRPNVGPYSLLAHMPEMAQRLEGLRLYLRDEASLSQKLQELVMISVAAEMGCAFIWYAHAAPARKAGVRDDVVDAIREKRALTMPPRRDSVSAGRWR